MGIRRHQTQMLVFAVLLAGGGCSGTEAKIAPIDRADGDFLPGETPDGELPAPDTDVTEQAGPVAMLDALTVPDTFAPETPAMVPDVDVLTDADAARPDVALPDANVTDAGPTDTAYEKDGLGPNDGLRPSHEPATVVLLPDTQYYSSLHPDIFARQSRWIVEQRRRRKIAAVLHVGDLVDVYDDDRQWQVASSAMHAMDGLVPYILTTGNHDTDANRVSPIGDHFAPATMPWIAGTMEMGRIDNSYTLADIGPSHWLVLALEYGPRDIVMTWADGVLKAYPDRLAIIVTHAYLYSDGRRYDLAVSGLDNQQPNFQWFIPQVYGYTAEQGINDGEAIWQKLVVPNPNVRLVFSGHANGATRLTSARPDGSLVHQVLSDYQGLYSGTADDLGGSGYLRIMEFDRERKTIRVQTYSPFLDSYLTDDGNQFTLSLEM